MSETANTRYIGDGKTTSVVNVVSINETLPSLNYSVEFSNARGFFLSEREKFSFPEKIYGVRGFPDRVIKTFNTIDRGLGVLLSGPKGSGKTLEAKLIASKIGMPVLLVTVGYEGAGFADFIESVKTPSVIFIDEFEKVYADESARNFFLGIMDGVAKSRHLFILTSNLDEVGEFFISRPGRVRYHKKYGFLDDELIEEIINDKLWNKSNVDTVRNAVSKLSQISMDSLSCIIEECNIHDDIPDNFMEFFNVERESNAFYDVDIQHRRAVPKQGLSHQKLREAKDAAYAWNEYSSKYDDFDELCEIKDITFRATAERDVIDDFDPYTGWPDISVDYAYGQDGSRSSFRSSSKELVEFKLKGSEFYAKSRDGITYKGRRVKFNRRAF